MPKSKVKKFRGSRTCGGGTHKNVGDLDSMASEDGRIDLGKMKVLGRGKLSRPVAVSAKAFSASARAKIEEAGGEVVIS